MWCCWICPNHDLGDAVWSLPPFGEDDGLNRIRNWIDS